MSMISIMNFKGWQIMIMLVVGEYAYLSLGNALINKVTVLLPLDHKITGRIMEMIINCQIGL